jgi:predicted nucleic acid-binding protein
MGYLLDTDVLSESSNPRPNKGVMAWMVEHDHELFLSSISVGEIVKGIELLSPGKRRREIEAWLARIEEWAGEGIGSRILAPTDQVMRIWGRLCARHEGKGRRLPVLDSLIAATAIANDLTLVTRNFKDHPDGISILNPWDE